MMKGDCNMMVKKNEKLFIIICIAVFVAALAYVFLGTREDVPKVEEHVFSIPVTYEQDGKSVTVEEDYMCVYDGEGRWMGYFENSGAANCIYEDEQNGDAWTIGVEIEAGYLMGDENYADFYADGMPEPVITSFDGETGEEERDLSELPEHGIKVIGCELPKPIENEFIDGGVCIGGNGSIVLAVLAAVLLILSLVMIGKKEEIEFGRLDKASTICNFIVGIIGVPLITILCFDWEFLDDGSLYMNLVHLIPAATVLGICASVILRRKGKSYGGFIAQFIVPVIFILSFLVGGFVGALPHSLTYIVGIVVGILIAVFSKKNEAAVETSLDRASVVTNLVLIPVYAVMSYIPVIMGAIADTTPGAGPLQGVLTVIISYIIAGAPIYCGISLGLSAAFRKKGKSKVAFIVQFAGVVCVVLTILIILATDFIPWMSISIN